MSRTNQCLCCESGAGPSNSVCAECYDNMAARIRSAETAAIVAFLRRPCGRDDHDDRWCETCETRDDLANAIADGEHRECE